MFKKIFFWLYATLLALPMVFIGANAIYYAFNDNAVSQTYDKPSPIYYESNDVNSVSDLIVGNVYSFNYSTSRNSQFSLQYSSIYNISGASSFEYGDNLPLSIQKQMSSSTVIVNYIDDPTIGYGYYDFSCDFVLSHVTSCNDLGLSFISKCEKPIIKDYQIITYTNGIVDSLVEATNRTFEVPMFSWVSSSPITQGLDGLFNLIGMTNTPLLNLIGYWVSISAIMLGLYAVVSVPIVIGRAFNIF